MTEPVFTPDSPIEMECPICNRVWTPTMFDDCCLPSCGCYGTTLNRATPCERCGISHGWNCPNRPGFDGRTDRPEPKLIEVFADGTVVDRGQL